MKALIEMIFGDEAEREAREQVKEHLANGSTSHLTRAEINQLEEYASKATQLGMRQLAIALTLGITVAQVGSCLDEPKESTHAHARFRD